MVSLVSSGKGIQIPVKDIHVTRERGRKDFSDLESLVDSIRKHGLIHPIVVATREEGGFELLAGERRFRACLMLGQVEVPCMFREELSGLERKEIELEENIRRRNLVWSEEIEVLRQIDELKREIHGEKTQGPSDSKGWTLQKTADLAGKSFSQTQREVGFAQLLLERPELKEKVKDLPLNVAIKMARRIIEGERLAELETQGKLKFDWTLELGDARSLIKKVPDSSVDLIITDPPYGNPVIEECGIHKQQPAKGASYTLTMKPADNLGPKEVEALIRELAPELFRVLKPTSHIYMFFAMELYQPLIDALTDAGFVINPVPIIWDKVSVTGPFLGYSYQNCYEPVLFGCKPPRSKRLANAMKAIIQAKPVRGEEKIHPFQKGEGIIRAFINQSSNLGDTVLDPFAGSGEVLVSSRRLLRKGFGFELDKENFLAAQARMLRLEEVDEEEVEEEGDEGESAGSKVTDFKTLEPGTSVWMGFWKAHPEQQEEMITFMMEQEEKKLKELEVRVAAGELLSDDDNHQLLKLRDEYVEKVELLEEDKETDDEPE